jgi:glycosyltransferase involved in cell wall biosynthesis
MRIGVVDRSVPGWAGGGIYSQAALAALSLVARSEELFFVSAASDAPAPARLLPLAPVDPLPGEAWLLRKLGFPGRSAPLPGESRIRSTIGLRNRADPFDVARRARLDVIVPVSYVPARTGRLRTVGWIPDFQHVHLPQFFPKAELVLRDRILRELAERSTLLMLSSEAARADFDAFAPGLSAKARVVRFASLFAHQPPAGDPSRTVRHLRLPEKFLLVVNQLWAHKNHAVVVEALARLRQGGLAIPAVFAGLPADFRDQENSTLSRVLQQIAAGGLSGQVTLLGRVSRQELSDLLRASAAVIQPSRFEGWNTTVEDAKALGRPLFCSDLAVHREQAPAALGFFGCDAPDELAALLASAWPGLVPGPSAHESQVLAEAVLAARAQGEALLRICHEAVEG